MQAEKSTLVLESGGDEAPEASESLAIPPKAEAALVRKQDLRVLPMVFLMYFFTFLGRSKPAPARNHRAQSQTPSTSSS